MGSGQALLGCREELGQAHQYVDIAAVMIARDMGKQDHGRIGLYKCSTTSKLAQHRQIGSSCMLHVSGVPEHKS